MRCPLRGFESLYFSRSAMSTGIRDSAHSMRSLPLSASLRSATLKFAIGVISSFGYVDECLTPSK